MEWLRAPTLKADWPLALRPGLGVVEVTSLLLALVFSSVNGDDNSICSIVLACDA